jgi:adenosylcobinamide-GDP ribazoletransferase
MNLWRQFLGAVTFYSIIPVPAAWQPEFLGIARWCPAVGLLLGVVLAGVLLLLRALGLPHFVSSALVVALGLGLTGGLHLDGAMDTADGLGVPEGNLQRRLAVMSDSHTGAFGVISAVLIILLKTVAIAALVNPWQLVTAALWARWGQLLAIACYPYLKPTGKGHFHKANLKLPQDLILGSSGLLAWSGWQLWQAFAPAGALLSPARIWAGSIPFAGLVIASGVGYWFYKQLGGHTGDTYGAVVEWTEALLLCYLTLVPV